MCGKVRAALFLSLALCAPLHLAAFGQGSPGEILSDKDARRAEASASTASDHARLAAYYRSKADQAEKNLAYAQDLEKQWSWMAGHKVPNAYTHALSLADRYSDDLQKYNRLAAQQQSIAKSLEAGAAPNQ